MGEVRGHCVQPDAECHSTLAFRPLELDIYVPHFILSAHFVCSFARRLLVNEWLGRSRPDGSIIS